MAKSNYLEQQFINQVFGGVAASTYASVYIALHTAAPAENGDQTSNEASFVGYARQEVQVPSGWTLGTNNACNTLPIEFPAAGSPQLITHFSVGTAASGTGSLLYFGQLTESVQVEAGLTLRIPSKSLTVTEE